MINKALFCKNCGYVFNINDVLIPRCVENGKCPICRHELHETQQDASYFNGRTEKSMPTYEDVVRNKYLKNATFDKDKAIKRAKKERDKYEQQLNAFKNVSKKTEQNQFVSKSVVECPYCHSTNTKKITNTSKAVHTAIFGIFSMSRNSKQWHCNECNSDF